MSRDPYDWVEGWAWPAIERGDVPAFAALVMLRLAAHANRAGMAWPSSRRLAAMVGRSDNRRVRAALAQLRDLGLIDGEPVARRVTHWRLVEDENEQRRLRDLRATKPGMDPCPVLAATGDPGSSDGSWLPERAIWGASEAHLRTRPPHEGEGEEHLSLPTEAKDAGEREISFDPRNLVQFKRMGPA